MSRTTRTLAPLLAAALAMTTLGTSPASAAGVMDNACPPDRTPSAPFFDTFDNPHEEAIDCVAWYRIASGVSENEYAPEGLVRRDQLASFMARSVYAMRGSLPEPGAPRYDDVDGNPHGNAIARLAEAGIVGGTGARTYSPERLVQRGAMATFLVSTYQHLTGTQLTASRDYFSDDNGTTHEASINKAAEAGFAGGVGDGRFAPSGSVRRDQMASFISRMIGLAVDRAPGGRLEPYPLETTVRLVDDWELAVVSSDPDANEEIAAENEFNDPPQAGHQFYLVRIRATYRGQGSSRFDGGFRLRALGDSGVTYTQFENDCGVTPDSVYDQDRETFEGGGFEANICFEVRSGDAAAGLEVYDDEEERPSRPYFATTG